MAIHQVTLELPEVVCHIAEQTAATVQRPVETVLVEALTATLPSIIDLPEGIATEVAEFFGLEDSVLLAIADETLPPVQQRQLTRLLNKNSEDALTKEEQGMLDKLMDEYWRITLRKSQARAILAQRTQARVPKVGFMNDEKVSAKLRRTLAAHAGRRCGYCRAPEEFIGMPLHIEHLMWMLCK